MLGSVPVSTATAHEGVCVYFIKYVVLHVCAQIEVASEHIVHIIVFPVESILQWYVNLLTQ